MTWRFGVLIAFLASAVSAAAFADPSTAYEALHFPDTPDIPLKSPPLGILHAGALPVRLEQTRLGAVQRRFGGKLHRGGDAADGVTWLCYARSAPGGGAIAYWFLSNDEMGGGTRSTQLAVQRLTASPDPSCGPTPKSLQGLDFGLPTIGARLEDVRRRFGEARPSDGYLSYRNMRPAENAKDAAIGQEIRYHLTSGVVDTVSVEQVTST